MSHAKSVSLVAALLLAAGCASHRARYQEIGTVTRPEVISCWANWVKDKGSSFDVSIGLRNESRGAILVDLDDFTATRGGSAAAVRHAGSLREKTVHLLPGQVKPVTLACESADGTSKGPCSVTIRRVYGNPGSDGVTHGDVIAENVVWTSP